MVEAMARGASLAGLMEEVGPACTATDAALQDVLKQLPAPTEHAVGEVLGMVARTSAAGSPLWNVSVLVEGLKAANPALDWMRVAYNLDSPAFAVPDEAALEALMAVWRQATPEPFPLGAIVGGLWTNTAGQLAFLRQATAAPPEVFSWSHAERRQEPLEGLNSGKSPTGTPNQCWMALDLYATLAKLADSGYAPAVRAVLEAPLKTCPELMLLGAASVTGGWGPLHTELVDPLVANCVGNNATSGVVLARLWTLNSDLVLRAMVALHAEDIVTVGHSLDICHELKAMAHALDVTPAPFCLELAALAARREYLNLEIWLGEQCAARGAAFMQSAVAFLECKLRDDVGNTTAAVTVTPRLGVSVETLAVFLKVLAANASVVPTDTLQQLKLVQSAAVQAYPELASVVADAGNMEAFPEDVEREANDTFKMVYAGTMAVEALVDMLRNHKNSTLAREQEVFACMVHNLFDEFRFFARYPDKELYTTGVLFGQMVAQGLLTAASLGIALRYVLDALRQGPANAKLWRFGTTAARQFAADMSRFPAFAAQLAALPGLKDSDPELVAAAEAAVIKVQAASSAAAEAAKAAEAAAAALPPAPAGPSMVGAASGASFNAAGFPTSMPAAPANPNMLFSTINAETLEQAAQTVNYPVPDEKTIDRVHFVVNNLSSTNVEAKVKELSSLVPGVHHPWFVNYLVVKRAAQEPNFHPTYVALVDRWGDRALRHKFVAVTVHYCKVMLASKLLKVNSSERTLLKNLGAWLGKLTLARNRPVLQRDLDVKATIIEAFEGGRMLPVLSFVRNLLEPCGDSKVFRPPSPWVMAILSLLAEIYGLAGIKTSIKFEVELLFKQLGLQLADVQPSALLVGLARDQADNMDFQAVRPPPPVAAAAAGRPGEGAAAAGAPGADGKAAAAAAAAAGPVVDPSLLASLHNFITINPQLAIVGDRLQLKRLVPMAVERAVVEIISPVVDRSVTIACMTAHELVVKDFAMEADPEGLRRSAHLSVAGLAQSLALVTAREPLRLAVTNNLRALLANQLEPAALEQVVALLVGDNLDLCCQVIERAAGERAQREIDERLAVAYAARARAKAAGQAFADAAQMQGRFPGALPDVLRAKPTGLTPQQQRVYQDFATIPRTAAEAQQSAAAAAAASSRPGAGMPGEGPGPGGDLAVPAGGDPQVQLRARFISWLQRMDAAVAKDPGAAAASLPDGHEIKALVAEVASLPTGEAQAIEVGKTLFAKLYQGATAAASANQSARLHCTAYAGALAVLRDTSARRLPGEASSVWLSQLPEDMRYHKEAVEVLVRAGVLLPAELDIALAKSLAGQRYQPAAEALLSLLQSCVLGPEPVLSAVDLPASLDALSKLAARVSGGHAVLALVEEARRASALRAGAAAAAAKPAGAPEPPRDPPQLVEAVMKVFDRWARLLEEQPSERVHSAFVGELRESGMLGGEEATERFVRVMTQLAVQHCLRSEAAAAAGMPPGAPRPAALSFIAVDAFVRLMVCLVTQHGGGPPLFSRILGVIAAALHRDVDERAGAFNGRPYFRMLVGFLAELSPADPSDEAGVAYLQAVAGFLHATRPLRAPGFTFPWLQLVADRRFMPRLLMAPAQRGWPPYLQLLLAQLRFMEPFLRHAELTEAVRLLYRGTLRLLLVLLHDFPEFLCQFHFRLCDAIPLSCIQMRNLVLSAFPRSMRLPDPFTPNLKVDILPEVAQPPRFSPPPEGLLPPLLRAEVDAILAGQAPPGAAAALRARLLLTPAEAHAAGTHYNAPLLNAVVFYIGARAVESSAPPPGTPPPTAGTPAMEIYSTMLRDLDGEGRYLLVNALANHLRYPNSHTHYFSCVVLALFEGAGSELVQEQVTRVLLERLIVNRPHPWGLLITFIELIKNPRFNFWSHAFVKAAPEIERLFESVARSCMGPQQAVAEVAAQPQAVSG